MAAAATSLPHQCAAITRDPEVGGEDVRLELKATELTNTRSEALWFHGLNHVMKLIGDRPPAYP